MWRAFSDKLTFFIAARTLFLDFKPDFGEEDTPPSERNDFFFTTFFFLDMDTFRRGLPFFPCPELDADVFPELDTTFFGTE
jgi:hypothetical protein